MKRCKKQMKIVVAIMLIFALIVGIKLYTNFANEKSLVSRNASVREFYSVTLEEDNCDTTTENNVTTIQKYNGSADTIIINKDMLSGDTLVIDSKAFLECANLDSILIDKEFVNENLQIENFEVSNDYEDEQYVKYINTQEYSEAYKQYLELSDEEKK